MNRRRRFKAKRVRRANRLERMLDSVWFNSNNPRKYREFVARKLRHQKHMNRATAGQMIKNMDVAIQRMRELAKRGSK